MNNRMIPAGYQAIFTRCQRQTPGLVVESYGINSQISEEFVTWDYRLNGHEFFDSIEIIEEVSEKQQVVLDGAKLFYYEVYEFEYAENDQEEWQWFELETSKIVDYEGSLPCVILPLEKKLEGYDIVGYVYNLQGTVFSWQNDGIAVNNHGLVESIETCKQLLESKQAHLCCREPGSLRIYAVYSVPWKYDPIRAPGESAPYVEIRSDGLSLRDYGRTFVYHMLNLEEIEIMRSELALIKDESDILAVSPGIKAIAESPYIIEAVADLLEGKPNLIRATKNYFVEPGDEKSDVKETIVLCIYLDDGSLENGAIKFLPEMKLSYHSLGRMIGFRPSFFHLVSRDESLPPCRSVFLVYARSWAKKRYVGK